MRLVHLLFSIFICVLAVWIMSDTLSNYQQFSNDTPTYPQPLKPTTTQQTHEPTTTQQTHEPTTKCLISNISEDLSELESRGWSDLYEADEFDCSRMSAFMWVYLREKYRILPKIIIAPQIEHAWIAVRVVDVGINDQYPVWTIKGVDYYYIETTVPRVVGEDISYFDDVPYVYVCEDPLDANDFGGVWSNGFRLTKTDMDKINQIVDGYQWR